MAAAMWVRVVSSGYGCPRCTAICHTALVMTISSREMGVEAGGDTLQGFRMSRRFSSDTTRYEWTERPDPHEARRWHLMVAARAVVERLGMEFTIEDVTREARVAKGTFYLYFTSRDELLAAMRLRLAQDVAALCLASAAGPWDGLWERVMDAGADWYGGLGRLREVFAPDSDTPTPERIVMVGMARSIVEAGEAAGVFALPACEPGERELLEFLTHQSVERVIVEACRAIVAGMPEARAAGRLLLDQLLRFTPQPGEFVPVTS